MSAGGVRSPERTADIHLPTLSQVILVQEQMSKNRIIVETDPKKGLVMASVTSCVAPTARALCRAIADSLPRP